MSYGFQIGADSMSSTIRKYDIWLRPGCQLMLRSIDSGGAALTQNQLSAAVTSGGAPLTRGGVELGGLVVNPSCVWCVFYAI